MSVNNFEVAGHVQLRRTVFAPRCRSHLAAERMCEPLHPVADAQHRHAQLQHLGIAQRRVLVVHRTRPAGQNDAHGFERANFLQLRGARQNRGEHLLLADPPRDQLRVLPAEIQHHNSLSRAHRASGFLLRCGSGMRTHKFPRIRAIAKQYLRASWARQRVFVISLPAISTAMRGSVSARFRVSSSLRSSSTRIFPRSRPLI